jgi:hypothetical protein
MKYDFEHLANRVEYCKDTFGEAKRFRLERSGDLDLVLDGWEISTVDDGALRPDRATVDVSTFYSIKGSYIAEITRHMPNREGTDKPHVVKSKADAFSSQQQLLVWLKEDGRGWLGENSKVAWEEMCEKLPWLIENNAIRV